ncbi:MAG: hypothetical protein ACYC4K_09025 [Thiobacillus sp.]
MKTIALLLCLTLSACAVAPATTTPLQSAQTQFVQACGTYNAAFAIALKLRQSNQLTPAQITEITQMDSVMTPICTGALPADQATINLYITEVVTSAATLAAISKGAK